MRHRDILVGYTTKLKRQKGKIHPRQMNAIKQLPMSLQKKIFAVSHEISRQHATPRKKSSIYDLEYNKEILKRKAARAKEKRDFNRGISKKKKKVESGLAKLLASIRAKQDLKEGSDGIMKEEIDKGKAERIRDAVSDRHGNWDFKSGKFTDKGKNLAKRAVRMIAKRGSPEVENLKDKISDRHNTWDFKRGNFTTKGLKMINKAKGMYHVKEDSEKEAMLAHIKRTSEDTRGSTDHDPRNYNQMARQYVMSKYKDGYLKKEAAMQQMGMIGVPKDEVLKMFGVETVETELDEEGKKSGRPPWKNKPGDYEKHGKGSPVKKRAKFLQDIRKWKQEAMAKKKMNEVKDGGYSWDTHNYLHGLDTGKIKPKPAFSAHIPARGYFNSEKEYRALSRKEAGTHKGVDRKNKAGTLTSIGNKTRNKRSEALKKLFKEEGVRDWLEKKKNDFVKAYDKKYVRPFGPVRDKEGKPMKLLKKK